MPFRKTESGEEFWVPSMSPKGEKLFFLSGRKFILCHGPRKATKSNSIQHTVIKHAFDFEAIVGIIVKGKGSAVASGVWADFTSPRKILWEWTQAGFGFEVTKEPAMLSDTKMRYFKIRNRLGTESEVQLHTLERDADIEKFKDTRFSCLYLVEADRFDSLETFNRLVEQLRLETVPHDDRKIYLDCNPPAEAEDHWLYRTFIRNDKGEYMPDKKDKFGFQDYYEMGFVIDDNPFISDREKEEIRRINEHDPIQLARYYYGKWVKDAKGSLFEKQFRPGFHVVGRYDSKAEEDSTILGIPSTSFEMPCGWDLGDSLNHAAVIGCRAVINDNLVILVLDERVVIGENYSTAEFTRDFIEKMDYWEAYAADQQKGKKLYWRHWSDSSSMVYQAAGDTTVAMEVYNHSGKRIALQKVQKGSGSVMRRVQLLKRALFSNRIFVSAKCVNVVNMLTLVKADKHGEISETSQYKHVFDALTYMLAYELPQYVIDVGGSTPSNDNVISMDV
jgi:PBSX family phage terminase large subunit